MINKHESSGKELIFSENRSLALKKDSLIKRGLALIDEAKKRRVEILIGDFKQANIAETVFDFLQRKFMDRYNIRAKISCIGEELLELAENSTIDIFILVLNNIWFAPEEPLQDRLEKSLQLITQFKEVYGKPVIALSGWNEDSYVARAKLAADFFFLLPPKLDSLGTAFEKSLEMILEFDEFNGKNPK